MIDVVHTAGGGQAGDAKSPYTSGHRTRVADPVDRIAGALALSPQRRRWLRRGALLHDLGKLAVSNAVLDKPGSLETRIITVADIFDAISAERPYRAAVRVPQTLQMMAKTVGSAIDPLGYEALCSVVAAPTDMAGAAGR